MSTRTKRKPGRKLAALVAAALALPGISMESASAQSVALEPVVRFRYGEYRDHQGNGDRMRVHAPMFSFRTPVGESTDVEGTLMYESISGASPLFLSTLSGSSGIGVHDQRRTGDFKVTRYFDRFSLAVGGSGSNEDDYESNGVVGEARTWTADKNTVLALAGGADFDNISSTIDKDLNEERTTTNLLLGVTQVIDPISVFQSNLTYSSGDGLFSDPYKPLDNRPRSREQFAWLNRYVRYIEKFDASLHADYRLYRDTFEITAHTFELAWYQPLGTVWTLRPNARYYSQNKADFFRSGRFPVEAPEGFFSADQRLSSFGSWGGGLKVSRELPRGFSFDASWQIFEQRRGFHLGSLGSDHIEPFYGWFFLFGLTKQF